MGRQGKERGKNVSDLSVCLGPAARPHLDRLERSNDFTGVGLPFFFVLFRNSESERGSSEPGG